MTDDADEDPQTVPATEIVHQLNAASDGYFDFPGADLSLCEPFIERVVEELENHGARVSDRVSQDGLTLAAEAARRFARTALNTEPGREQAQRLIKQQRYHFHATTGLGYLLLRDFWITDPVEINLGGPVRQSLEQTALFADDDSLLRQPSFYMASTPAEILEFCQTAYTSGMSDLLQRLELLPPIEIKSLLERDFVLRVDLVGYLELFDALAAHETTGPPQLIESADEYLRAAFPPPAQFLELVAER